MSNVILNRLVRFVGMGLLLFTVTTSLTAQLPAGVKKGASVEGITEYTLDNGLRVLIFPDASKPTATVNITYLVGSRHEGYGETGMSHLLEHMVFKGTDKHPNIPQEMSDHGGNFNGTTNDDRTNYFEILNATDVNIEWALSMEADRMVNSHIAKKDLETEFSVVRNEYESGENSPNNVLNERVTSTAYLWHNYGKSTIGARSDIEQVPIERLQAYYHRYYQPDNAVLMVAGKVDETKVLKMIVDKFGVIPRPIRALDRGNMIFPTYTEEPTQDGEREVTLRRTGDVQLFDVVYHVPAGTHADFPAIAVMSSILSSQPNGRLYKALVETKKATAAFAFAGQQREPGLLVGMATLRKDQSLADARTAMLQTFETFADAPPTVEEVDRAKTLALKNLDLLLTNSQSVGLTVSEWAARGDWRLIYVYRDALKKVTAADVQRVAKAYIKPSNRTIGQFIPTDKPDRAAIPAITVAEITALTKDYKGNALLAAGEVFDASPSNIEVRTSRSTLSNGFKVALLPKTTRGNTVTARITLRFGDEKSLTGRVTAATWMAGMLNRGTKTKTRQQILDTFDKLKTQFNVGGAGNNVSVSLNTTHENLIPALRLAAEVLKEPAFPQSEFDTYKAAQIAGVEAGRSEPQVLAPTMLSRRMSPYPSGHPLATNTVDEEIAAYKATTIDEVKKVYTEMVGATYGDIAVVGDFNNDSVAMVTRELFSTWKSPKPFTRIVRKYFDVPAFNATIETPDKANSMYMAGLNLQVRDDSREYAALLVANYALGGGPLNSRLAVRIRQKDGLSYGVASNLGAASLDSVGAFQEFAIYNPENVVKLESAFGEELDRALKEGFGADELEKSKQAIIASRVQSRSIDGAIVGALSTQVNTGRTMAFEENFDKTLSSLTSAEINAAFKKYVLPSKISVVKAGDFAGHPPKTGAIKP